MSRIFHYLVSLDTCTGRQTIHLPAIKQPPWPVAENPPWQEKALYYKWLWEPSVWKRKILIVAVCKDHQFILPVKQSCRNPVLVETCWVLGQLLWSLVEVTASHPLLFHECWAVLNREHLDQWQGPVASVCVCLLIIQIPQTTIRIIITIIICM